MANITIPRHRVITGTSEFDGMTCMFTAKQESAGLWSLRVVDHFGEHTTAISTEADSPAHELMDMLAVAECECCERANEIEGVI